MVDREGMQESGCKMSGQLQLAEQIIRETEQLLKMQRAFFDRKPLLLGGCLYKESGDVLKICKRAEKALILHIANYWQVSHSLAGWKKSAGVEEPADVKEFQEQRHEELELFGDEFTG